MNRQQRRAAARGRSEPVAQKLEQGPMQIQHGHSDTQVFIGFGRLTDHVLLSPAQAEAFLAAVQHTLAQLKKKIAGG